MVGSPAVQHLTACPGHASLFLQFGARASGGIALITEEPRHNPYPAMKPNLILMVWTVVDL